MSSQVISSDKATVIIQINPQVVQKSAKGQDETKTYPNAGFKSFFKAQPKSLGIVQIMIGVMIVLFGIELTVNTYGDILVFSGITYWGSFIYIIAGALSVAAKKNLSPCVVKASLGMNVLSAITAGIAIILMSIHLTILRLYGSYSPSYSQFRDCSASKGITGIALVFTILQFIISIYISAFACKATCTTNTPVVNVSLNQTRFSEKEISPLKTNRQKGETRRLDRKRPKVTFMEVHSAKVQPD